MNDRRRRITARNVRRILENATREQESNVIRLRPVPLRHRIGSFGKAVCGLTFAALIAIIPTPHQSTRPLQRNAAVSFATAPPARPADCAPWKFQAADTCDPHRLVIDVLIGGAPGRATRAGRPADADPSKKYQVL
jgi:hypothetical protein